MAKPAEQFLAVDFGVLAELDDNEAALELVQMYEEETKGVLSQLEGHLSVEEGSEAQSWSSIWAFLHKLKGSSLSIGLTGLAEFIESLRNSDTSTLREVSTLSVRAHRPARRMIACLRRLARARARAQPRFLSQRASSRPRRAHLCPHPLSPRPMRDQWQWYPNTFAELKYAVDHGVKKIMDEIQKQ